MRILQNKFVKLVFSLTVLIGAINHVPAVTRAQNGCSGPYCIFLPWIVRSHALEVDASITCYRQSPYAVVGYVENVTGETVYSATLSADIYDQDGILYGNYTGAPALVATFPNGTNPFIIWTDIGFECSDNIGEFDVSVDSWSWYSPVEYQPVTVLSVVLSSSGFETEVSGEIKNDQTVSLTDIKVLVQPGSNSFYQFATLDQASLAPGEVTGYRTSIFHAFEPPPGGAVVQGQGNVVP